MRRNLQAENYSNAPPFTGWRMRSCTLLCRGDGHRKGQDLGFPMTRSNMDWMKQTAGAKGLEELGVPGHSVRASGGARQ